MVFMNDETLSDNRGNNYCAQCKECKKWGNNPKDYRSNKHDKVYCDEFPFPNSKPYGVIHNTDNCPFRKV